MSNLLDSFLHFLGEMVSLEELTIAVQFKDDSRPGGADLLAQVLRYTRSSHLKRCDIALRSGDQYECKRGDLIEIISGEAMQQCLQCLPSIPEFIIRVKENDAAFNKDWWTTEITKKLPALKDTLTMHVRLLGMSDPFFFIEGQCTELTSNGKEWARDLWMEDLPAEAASSM